MGKISSSKLDNGMIGLEITYGGPEAPFGGIDSTTPLYIDPRCFSDAANFLIVNGCLVAFRWELSAIALGSWPSGAKYLKSGHFYQNGQYWNWTLAVVPGTQSGTPPSVTDNYTMWVWSPVQGGGPATNPIPPTATQAVTQTQVVIGSGGTPATGSFLIHGSVPNVDGTVNIEFNSAASGNNVEITVPVTHGQSLATIASNAASAINASSNPNVFATAAVDSQFTNQVDLTAKVSGTVGNALWFGTFSNITGSTGIIFPVTSVNNSMSGGTDVGGVYTTTGYGGYLNPVSFTNIGETLYIGGHGSVILQYSQSGGVVSFGILTNYLGAMTLGKYNNMLIAAGVVPGPGTVIQAPEMVLAWSASGQFQIWNPIDSAGNPTGAGFNQFADISDYLTGIFINPGSAIILRTQGIDYITPLSSGASPFDFAHISNALSGEGCQDMRLQCQYDQIGMFVGNTNIYQFSGGIKPIGDKIKDRLIADAQYVGCDSRGSVASTIYQDLGINKAQTLFLFVVKNTVYVYSMQNTTWTAFPLVFNTNITYDLENLCYSPGTNTCAPSYEFVATFNPFLVSFNNSVNGAPQYWNLAPWVQDSNFPYGEASFVLWPMEEISHGRDITIDGLLVTLWGSPGLVLNWSISGVLQAAQTLPASASSGFWTYQITFGSTGLSSSGVLTVKYPQLRLDLPLAAANVHEQLSIAKITMFGSFDPSQRPV